MSGIILQPLIRVRPPGFAIINPPSTCTSESAAWTPWEMHQWQSDVLEPTLSWMLRHLDSLEPGKRLAVSGPALSQVRAIEVVWKKQKLFLQAEKPEENVFSSIFAKVGRKQSWGNFYHVVSTKIKKNNFRTCWSRWLCHKITPGR